MIIKSKNIFITSAVFFAFVDRNHPKHQQSSAYFRYFAKEKYHLTTASFSISKTYYQLRKHMSYPIAKDFLRALFLGNIEITYPDESMTKAALKLIFQNTGYDLTIDQALTNIIAYRAQIHQICSFEYSSFYFGISLFSLPF